MTHAALILRDDAGEIVEVFDLDHDITDREQRDLIARHRAATAELVTSVESRPS